MIISRTPFRVSFFGGGTDYPTWYERHGGSVLCTTINKYCYITARYLPPFFEHRIRVVYSRTETCQTLDEIQHPAIREVLRFLNITRGVEIHHDGDLPARSGLGSSSAFTVGLLNAMLGLQGRLPSRSELACNAIHIEREILGETVGSQDQVAAAHGGLNHVRFHPDGGFDVVPLTLRPERVRELESHLMLFYTGITRNASAVASSYAGRLAGRPEEMNRIQQLVPEGVSILTSGRAIEGFGRLLHEGWLAKRALGTGITHPRVEEWYEAARGAGALGGKLIGAGGGGFMLLFVPPDRQARVRVQLANLLHVPFRFESAGTQIIFYDPQEDFEAVDRERELSRSAAA